MQKRANPSTNAKYQQKAKKYSRFLHSLRSVKQHMQGSSTSSMASMASMPPSCPPSKATHLVFIATIAILRRPIHILPRPILLIQEPSVPHHMEKSTTHASSSAHWKPTPTKTSMPIVLGLIQSISVFLRLWRLVHSMSVFL